MATTTAAATAATADPAAMPATTPPTMIIDGLDSSNVNISTPPPSIAQHTEEILHACELAEMSPLPPPSFLLVTQLAGLLYLGEYAHAKHLWERCGAGRHGKETKMEESDDARFHQLWRVAQAMAQHDSASVFSLLHSFQQDQQQPFSTYAAELAEAYRTRLLKLWQHTYTHISLSKNEDAVKHRLGLAEFNDLKAVLQQHGWIIETLVDGSTRALPPHATRNEQSFSFQMEQITRTVTFLDRSTKLNAE